MPIELSTAQMTGWAPKMRLLNSEEAAYLAGIVDGEGSIGFSRRYRTSDLEYGFVCVYNTHEPLMIWLRSLAGGLARRKPFIKHPPGAKPVNAKPLYTWRVDRQDDVAYLIRVMLPYLRIKDAAARDTLVGMATRRAWNRANWHPPH
jgi:hypothetical protein